MPKDQKWCSGGTCDDWENFMERNGKKDLSRHTRNEKYDIRSELTAT